MLERRRMMMKKKSEDKNLQWIRLDTLRDWLKPWDTTIINADNPVQTTDKYPIYAVAVLSTAGTSMINVAETQFFAAPYDKLRMSMNNRLVMYVDQNGNLVFPRTDVAQRGFIRQNIETLNEGTQDCYVYYNSIGSRCYSTDYRSGVMYFNRYQTNAALAKYWALIDTDSGTNPLSLSRDSVTVSSTSGTTSVVLYNNGVALTGIPSSEIAVSGNGIVSYSGWDSTTGTVTLNHGSYQGYSTGRYPITISYGGYRVEFVVFKNPPVRLATDKESVTVGGGAETVRLYVTNNNNAINNTSDVTYSGTYGSKSASGYGYIDISIPANNGSSTRTWTATISFNDGYDSGSTTVSFSQSGATIISTVTTVENVSVTINHYNGNNNVMDPDGINKLSTYKWELYWYPYVSLNASYDIVNTYTWSNGTTTSETVSHKNISHNFSPQIYYTLEYKSAGNYDLVSTPKNWGASWSDGQLIFDQSATVTRSMINPTDNTVEITHEGWLYLPSTGATNMNANNAPMSNIGYGVPVAYRYTSSVHFTNSAPDTSTTMTMISKTVTS